jgi:hypothetical protein
MVCAAPHPKEIMPVNATNAGSLRDFSRTKIYDVLAATPLLAWFALGLWKLAPQAASDARTSLAAPFELARLLDLHAHLSRPG